VASTPEEWFPILAKRLEDRMPKILLNRRYSTGDAPMPEMGKNTRDSWVAFQRKARTDMGGLACQSLAGRMVPNGVRVGTSFKGVEVDAARKIWRDNRLDIVFADAIWDMLSTSVGYLITGIREGEPVITAEAPEQVITAPDPAQPWRARAALKAWRDPDVDKDFAYVWVPGVRQRFSRASKNDNGTPYSKISGEGWSPDGEPEEYAGPVPVYVLDNFKGVAEFEPHIDVIDRINLGKLQRMVIAALQAFKQRAVKGLTEKDDDGNDIDWRKVFEPGPGALWDLPEGVDIWESESIDIRPLLEAEKEDKRDFAGVMQVPIDVFMPDGQNQSATGANNAHKGEIQKAKNRIARATAPMAGALLQALRILGLDAGATIEVLWEPPEHISFSEKTAAAVAAKSAGYSSRWIAQNIMGLSPDEIQQNEEDLAAEQLQQFALTGAGAVA